MNVGELIQQLQQFDPSMEVMVLDGFNGGGSPRTINLGPSLHAITEKYADMSGDCEGRVGEQIVRMGYGSY